MYEYHSDDEDTAPWTWRSWVKFACVVGALIFLVYTAISYANKPEEAAKAFVRAQGLTEVYHKRTFEDRGICPGKIIRLGATEVRAFNAYTHTVLVCVNDDLQVSYLGEKAAE